MTETDRKDPLAEVRKWPSEKDRDTLLRMFNNIQRYEPISATDLIIKANLRGGINEYNRIKKFFLKIFSDVVAYDNSTMEWSIKDRDYKLKVQQPVETEES